VRVAGSGAADDGDAGTLRLDDVDRRIIAALQVDGRRPYSRIAQEVGVSESAVRYRARRLEDEGVIQVVGIADPLRIGFDLMALIGIKVRSGYMRDVVAAIAALPETSYVAVTAGGFDLIAEVICRETAHFTDLLIERIQGIEGVDDTESFLVLQIHKMAYGWGVPEVATPVSPTFVSGSG
jgi:Lrp/AsnC family transcriptional regulator, regulator for asnA, asnC and gidA